MFKVDINVKYKRETFQYKFELQTNRGVLFGPSGSGKTTLLRALVGFIIPYQGNIYINNKCIFDKEKNIDVPIYSRNIGYVPQESSLFPNMTIEDNILYGVKARGLNLDKDRFKKIIRRFQLENKLNDSPLTLSGGQLQRAALARILILKPDILLLDEPFNSLDNPIRECLQDSVIELTEEMNIPILFVTHDLEEAFIIGKELIVIRNGNVLECGLRKKIFESPVKHETARLLNFKNIWAISSIKNDNIIVANNSGEIITFKIQNPPDNNIKFACIKPENVRIVLDDKKLEMTDKPNTFSGIVKNIHQRGKYCKIELDVNNFLFVSHLTDNLVNNLDLKNGKTVKVFLEEKNIILCSQ